MNPLSNLIALSGKWQGTNVLHDPETNMPAESGSSITWTPFLGNCFIRAEYTWQYRGTDQEGFFLIGYEADTQAFTLHWIDTWHMGDKVMACRGSADENEMVSVLGSYGAPDGPDWGWQISIIPGTDHTLRIEMKNITPDGQEFPAVQAAYSRV